MPRESPFAFRPERFVGVTRGTYTWLPFGGGCRRCLGASFALQELKIVLRAVVERLDLAPVGDQEKMAPTVHHVQPQSRLRGASRNARRG